jgi:serine/threonine protein kinase
MDPTNKTYLLTVLDERWIAHFFYEVFSQTRSAHPCICPLFGWAVYEGVKPNCCLLLPISREDCLEARFSHSPDTPPPLTPIQKTIIAYGVARGMKHLHVRCRIIHGSLQLRNIILDSRLYPVVAHLSSRHPNPCMPVAVDLFEAPEHSRHDFVSCLKRDVYSFGVIMCVLVEECGPVWPDSRNVFERKRRRPTLSRASPEMAAWIGLLWHEDPFQRPSFTEICARMEKGECWFPGAESHKAEFIAYKEYIDQGETAQRLSTNKDEKITFPQIDAILRAASSGDCEARQLAAVMYSVGFRDIVPRSPLHAAKFSVEPLTIGLRTPRACADALDQGLLLEGSCELNEASLRYREAAEEGSVVAL